KSPDFSPDFSPDKTDHLAADSLLRSGPARDHPARRGKDSRPHSAQNAWQPVLARIDPPAGLRDPLQVGDHPLAVASELELDHEDVEALALLDVVVLDVALLLEEACDLLLQARVRHLGAIVHRLVGIPDAGEHVGDRIGQHRSALLTTSFLSSPE